MPAYKDTESGKWYSSFYYTDWTGERKRKLKRGFDTKKKPWLMKQSISAKQVLIWI